MFSRPGLFLVMTFLCLCHPMVAQDDEGYMFEMGLGGGGSFYMGDANSRLYRNTDGMFTLIARYNVNRRFSLKCGIAAAGISGSSENSNGTLPGDAVDFSRTLYEFGIQAEWGFCGYSFTPWEGCHRLAPYGLAGIGTVFAPKPASNVFALSFPIGMGMRYKLSERANVGIEWTMRFSSSDKLDVTSTEWTSLDDPFMIKGKGMKNKDSYSFTMLYITFDVFRRPCDCNDIKIRKR